MLVAYQSLDIYCEYSNGEAAHLKLELFNDIHGDSGAIMYQTVSSTSLQPRLATVGFTGTNGTGTPSNTQNNTK